MMNSEEINEINSLIIAQLTAEKNKTTIPIANIDRDYKEETGERIPYAKLGFPKLVDYLKTVPGVEVIEICNAHYVNFMGTEDSQHIVDLVSKQRYKNPPRDARRYPGYTKTLLDSHKSSIKTNRNITSRNCSVFFDNSFWNINCDTNHQTTNSKYVTDSNYLSEDLDYDEHVDRNTNRVCSPKKDCLHEIKASDCNIHYNDVEEEYRMNYPDMTKSHQQNITHETLLCSDNSENIIDTTDLREYIFSQNKDYVSTALSKRVKFRLEKLIQSRPQGIWCTELPKLYEEEYKIPLEWTNLGFHRLSDFTAHLSDIFHVVGPQLNGDFKLYNAKEPVPDDKPSKIPKKLTAASLFDIYGDVDIEPIPTSVPASFSKQLCPDDVITIQETVGQVLVTDLKISNNVDKNENPMVEVEVVEAYSPSFFWIRLLKNKNKFNKMMRSLGEFYDANYQKYAVPIIMLERGLNIACVFYGKWHRAIIKSVDPNCRVTVLFYDYGTVDKYPSNEIFYLHRSFTALPAQAVPCGLYSVAPHEGDKWPKRVRDWFTQWVCERPLWANIVEIDAERNSMLVTLADTSGKDDFFINDWLIDKKMAKVKKMVRIRPKNFLYERYLQCRNIGKSLSIEVGDDHNTRLIPNYNELISSESPLSRRMSLLKKFCDVSNHVDSSNKTNLREICPTCGNCTTQFIEQKSKIDNNREKSFDKVISWLKRHRMQQIENIEELSEHSNNIKSFSTKDIVERKDINSSVENSYGIEESVSLVKEVVDNDSTKKTYKNNINNNRFDNFRSKKLSGNDYSILSITPPIPSFSIHDLQPSDQNSDDHSDSIAQWHRKIEPINWDEIKTAVNTESKQLDHDSVTLLKNQPNHIDELSSTPKEKKLVLRKINESFKNFIKAYHPLDTFQEDILNLRPEHEIVKSDVITPMVIKTLNIINKSYESIEITIPDDIKEITQNNSKESFCNVSSNELSNDSYNLQNELTNSGLEDKNRIEKQKKDEDEKQVLNHLEISKKETMSEVSNKKDEIKKNENNIHNCEENSEKLNYFYHATIEKNLFERFNQLDLKSDEFKDNSELDSDDFDYSSTELSGSKNQDKEENRSESYESFQEYNEDNNNNQCKIMEIFPIKQNDEMNMDANRELTIIKKNHIPVFNDNESLTDDSEMDVCIEYDFLSQFYHQQTNSNKQKCTLKEIHSDDDSDVDIDDNDDELSEKSENISL